MKFLHSYLLTTDHYSKALPPFVDGSTDNTKSFLPRESDKTKNQCISVSKLIFAGVLLFFKRIINLFGWTTGTIQPCPQWNRGQGGDDHRHPEDKVSSAYVSSGSIQRGHATSQHHHNKR